MTKKNDELFLESIEMYKKIKNQQNRVWFMLIFAYLIIIVLNYYIFVVMTIE